MLHSCITPYNPLAQIDGETGVLVVEGNLSGGGQTTVVKLSRTVPLDQSYTYTPELWATVYVEEESSGQRFTLQERDNGQYEGVLPLELTEQYRLHIETSDSKVYVSDYVPVISSPPVDSVFWGRNDQKGVAIYVNTHDPNNSTHYYRWEFDEDWEFHTQFDSELDYDWVSRTYYKRSEDQHLYYCWNKKRSKTIVVGTSAQLVEDVIQNKQVHTLPYADDRLSYLYRIKVRQYGLTKTSYEYWEALQKNTEEIGDLFGPQPSNLPSNMQCVTDPSTPVIGYIDAGIPSVGERYIWNTEVAPWQKPDSVGVAEIIPIDPATLLPITDSIEARLNAGYLLLYYKIYRDSPQVDLYYVPRVCSDCTVKGTKNKPEDWITNHK